MMRWLKFVNLSILLTIVQASNVPQEKHRKPVIRVSQRQFHLPKQSVNNRNGLHVVNSSAIRNHRSRMEQSRRKICPEFCDCVDQNEDYVVLCSKVNLTTFPWKLHRNATILSLPQCDLSVLTPNMFHKLFKLRSLHMTRCGTRRIMERALWNLTSLQSVDFSGNNFERIHNERALDSAPDDLLAAFRPVALNASVHLMELSLAHNQICDPVAFDAFESLKFLKVFNLSNNHLSRVGEAFSQLMALTVLDLSHNDVSHLADDALPMALKLKELHLSHNRIKSLRNEFFRHLIELRMLDLSANQIEKVDSRSFQDLISLKQVRLQRNFISDVDNATFVKTRVLHELDLSSNRIESICPRSFRALNELNTLLLNDNLLSSIDSDLLYGLTSLRVLVVSNNRIRHVHPQAFKHLTELSYLMLDNNELDAISAFAFDSLRAVRLIRLRGNRLKSIEKRWFLAPTLRLESKHIVQVYDTIPIPDEVLGTAFYKAAEDHLAEYDLAGNRWRCDFSAQDFLAWLHAQKTLSVRDLRTLVCHEPFYYRGYLLTDFTVDQLPYRTITIGYVQTIAFFALLLLIFRISARRRKSFASGMKKLI